MRGRDAVPQPLGRGRAREGEHRGHLAVLLHLGASPRVRRRGSASDGAALVGVDGVEGVGAEQRLELLGRMATSRRLASPAHASPTVSPTAASSPRSRFSPARIRLFTVPSGSLEQHGDLAVRVAAEVGELDRRPLAVGQGEQRLAHLLGGGQVPHLVLEVVARLGGRAGVALLAGPARASDRSRSTERPWDWARR